MTNSSGLLRQSGGVPAKSYVVRWLLIFGMLEPLFFIVRIGSLGVLTMLACAGLQFLIMNRSERLKLLQVSPLLLYPILTLISSLWSESEFTPRFAAQLLVTSGLGLLIYVSAPVRVVISAIFGAALVACLSSLLMSIPGVLQGGALVGIAGSKNVMSYYATLLVLSGLGLSFDRQISRGWRTVTVLGWLFGALCVVLAQSAGGLVATIVAALLLIAAHYFLRAGPTVRVMVVAGVLLMVPLGVVSQTLLASEAATITEDVLGKDATLTGRTVLWQRAGQYIAEKPLIGHGYNAFWRQGSVEAEGLWRDNHIKSRTGFNFHNQFLEVLIDTGYVGLVVFVGLLVTTLVSLAVRLLRESNAELPFITGLLGALLIRAPVESLLLNMFALTTVMLFLGCTAAVFGHGASPVWARRKAQRPRPRRSAPADTGVDQTPLEDRLSPQARRQQILSMRAPRRP